MADPVVDRSVGHLALLKALQSVEGAKIGTFGAFKYLQSVLPRRIADDLFHRIDVLGVFDLLETIKPFVFVYCHIVAKPSNPRECFLDLVLRGFDGRYWHIHVDWLIVQKDRKALTSMVKDYSFVDLIGLFEAWSVQLQPEITLALIARKIRKHLRRQRAIKPVLLDNGSALTRRARQLLETSPCRFQIEPDSRPSRKRRFLLDTPEAGMISTIFALRSYLTQYHPRPY